MSQPYATRLREGIDAAKRGDKLAARRLLLQVLSADANNELALMWMASVVDTLNERRFYLERALQVNPNNQRAREALRRLGVSDEDLQRPPARATAARTTPQPTPDRFNIFLIAAAVVVIVVIAVIVASVVNALQPAPTPAPVPVIQATFASLLNTTPQTATPPPSPAITVTLPGIVVTLDQSALTPLPPTFTPTFTTVPTDTPQPTATPPPLSSFAIIYSDIEPGAAQPSLYEGNADGTGEVKLESGSTAGFSDVAFDKTAQRIAFVRPVGDGDAARPQLFVAALNALDKATQITQSTGSILAHPSWSPDGQRILFTSNQSGTENIWAINADGSSPLQLTTISSRAFDAAYAPDGRQIVFASDMDSPGFTKIYVMDTNGGNVTLLSDMSNSYSPAWSPDGKRIAFVSTQQTDGDIYVMDADGQRPFLLTVDDNGAEDRTPQWSPDGRWILFASNRDGDQFRWFAIDMQGKVVPVTVTGRSPESLAFVTH